MFQYPYGDSQQLNLDWLMEQWLETKASIDGSLQGEIDRVEAAITDLLTARDQAVAAQTAAETAATSASGYAGTASGAASTATAEAAAAAASAALAGSHASNAQTSETNAGLQATAAGNSASAAAVSEGNARNSELAAAASSSAAAGNALYAEGMAKGTQNGTPVTAGSPYYEDNAKYYADKAAQDASDAADSETAAAGSAAAAAASAASADGAAAQAMIAPVEASSTASAAHAAGEYFRMSGVLYQATADIAIGDTITPGTNCEIAVVGEDLTKIQETINTDQTIIWNDLVKLTDKWSVNMAGATITKLDDEVLFTGATAAQYLYEGGINGSNTATIGHKYVFIGKAKSDGNTPIGLYNNLAGTAIGSATYLTDYQIVGSIAIADRTTTDYNLQCRVYGTGAGHSGGFKNVKLFDLTLMGREDISTIDEFITIFPNWAEALPDGTGTIEQLPVTARTQLRRVMCKFYLFCVMVYIFFIFFNYV